MPFGRILKKLRTPIAEQDQEALRDFCHAVGGTARIADLQGRQEVTTVGEISSLRIVPGRASSPWLEATVHDGTGTVVVLWTGRRRIAGIRPGARLMITGRGNPRGPKGRLVFYNPRYELL